MIKPVLTQAILQETRPAPTVLSVPAIPVQVSRNITGATASTVGAVSGFSVATSVATSVSTPVDTSAVDTSGISTVMATAPMLATGGVLTPEKTSQTVRKPYPNYKVIVLNDDENTFEHVVKTLMRYIPGMISDQAWALADQIHHDGQAIVWTGPLEQAELYHMQLTHAGLTMAPLEAS